MEQKQELMACFAERGFGFLTCLDYSSFDKAEYWGGGAFALLAFALPLLFTLRSLIKTTRLQHYSELDHFYSDILQMAIEKPWLRDPVKISEFVAVLQKAQSQPLWAFNSNDPRHQHALQYDAYAFIVMNFLETIHDRCDDNRHWLRWPDPKLKSTWCGIIEAEYAVHGEWFKSYNPLEVAAHAGASVTRQQPRFCLGFCEFMLQERWNDARWKYVSEAKIRRTYKLPEIKRKAV